VLLGLAAGGGVAPAAAQDAATGSRQAVAAPQTAGETVLDVRPGTTVTLTDPAFEPPQASYAVDDDDLVIELSGRRTLILGGFFVEGDRPTYLALGERAPVAAGRLALVSGAK
jgi:hypothetical protein